MSKLHQCQTRTMYDGLFSAIVLRSIDKATKTAVTKHVKTEKTPNYEQKMKSIKTKFISESNSSTTLKREEVSHKCRESMDKTKASIFFKCVELGKF